MWRVRLTDEDEARIIAIATRRQSYHRQRGNFNKRIDGTRIPWSLDYVGVKGEYAFNKHLGLPEPTGGVGGDGGKKDETLGTADVEVKTASRPGLNFIIPITEELEADAGVLMELTKDRHMVNAVGWLTRDGWFRLREERVLQTPTWVVDRRNLADMDELLIFAGLKSAPPVQAAFSL